MIRIHIQDCSFFMAKFRLELFLVFKTDDFSFRLSCDILYRHQDHFLLTALLFLVDYFSLSKGILYIMVVRLLSKKETKNPANVQTLYPALKQLKVRRFVGSFTSFFVLTLDVFCKIHVSATIVL